MEKENKEKVNTNSDYVQYYDDLIKQCNEELKSIRKARKNIKKTDVKYLEFSKDALESKLSYYETLRLLESLEKRQKEYEELEQRLREVSVPKKNEEKKKNIWAQILDAYYEKRIDDIRAHLY